MLETLNPVLLAFIAGCFTWGMTALGSAFVFFFKNLNKTILNTMLGLAAGVMISASFWSLLDPAIDMAEQNGVTAWFPAVAGFLLGGLVLYLFDRILPHIHAESGHVEGVKSSFHRSLLLIFAITLHNLPEGFAVGVAFGGLNSPNALMSLGSALTLAVGMGIQNVPEGAAVSIPLRRENYSRLKAFLIGQASGIVEPIGAVLGAAAVYYISEILPYALSFAAGAMIYVVADELIPESQLGQEGESVYATTGVMIGFAIMMMLDVALG